MEKRLLSMEEAVLPPELLSSFQSYKRHAHICSSAGLDRSLARPELHPAIVPA